MDRFLAFSALEVLLWQKDSDTLEARKFRIYHDPVTDRMVFFPKGVERVLEKTDGALVPDCQGIVAKAVLTTPEGRRQYHQTVARLLDTVFKPVHVRVRAQELAAAIRPVAIGHNGSKAEAFDAAVVKFNEAVTRRAATVAGQLKRASAK
jgi:hypothetical protein